MSDKNSVNTSLLKQFTIAAQNVCAVIERTPARPDSLNDAILKAAGGAKKILFAEPEFLPKELFETFRKNPGVICYPIDEQISDVPVGVTEAFAGVARTGSICVAITPMLSGTVSLFTRMHIAIVRGDTIVPHPRDVFFIEHPLVKKWLKNFVFITGPSATADMGPLVRGVHGPGALHIIILI